MHPTHPGPPNICPPWDSYHIRIALTTARHLATRHVRGQGLPWAERDDLTQDILLAIVDASRHYDPARGAWSTFVSLVGRHVILDCIRAPKAPPMVALDPNTHGGIGPEVLLEAADPHWAIGLQRVADELPAAPKALLQLVLTHGDVADARRASGRPPASFYRALGDLRCWLRASGLRPPVATRRIATPRRSRGNDPTLIP